MAGISSKAAGKLENKRKFNDGTELTSELDLNLYETPFRSYDAQLGRFHQIDALSDIFKSLNPYIFAFNHPTRFNDPTGLIVPAKKAKEDLSAGKPPERFDITPNIVPLPTNETSSSEGSEDNNFKTVNFLVFESGPLGTPQTFKHIEDAIKKGAPSQLTYNGGGVSTDLNRNMDDGPYSIGRKQGSYPCFPGYWFDEYPFACTTEGGASTWLSVRCVPKREQQMQGWMLSGTIIMNGLIPGDKLNIILIGGNNPVVPEYVPIYAPKRILEEIANRMDNYKIYQHQLKHPFQKSFAPVFMLRSAALIGLGVLFIVQPELAPVIGPTIIRRLAPLGGL